MTFMQYVGALLHLCGYDSEQAWSLMISMQDPDVRVGYDYDDYAERVAALERYHPLWREAGLALINIMLGRPK